MADDQTIVVTGGSRGIGRAICVALAGPGRRIYFNYRSDAAAAETTVAAVEAAGGSAVAVGADVTDEAAVAGLFERVADEAKGVFALVNNAGITRDGLILRMKRRDWDAVMETNLTGAFFCTRAAAKMMIRARTGRIVNISSVVGSSGNPGQANYVSAKAGLIGLTKAVARELAPRGITVNAVAPGYVETDMTRDLGDKARDAMLAGIPLGRAGTAEEVASAVAFLVSDGAAYITGQVIGVNGGMYM
jgi:3-oxoacyl-[acyl-carrier protein] reductase